jgi:transketolase
MDDGLRAKRQFTCGVEPERVPDAVKLDGVSEFGNLQIGAQTKAGAAIKLEKGCASTQRLVTMVSGFHPTKINSASLLEIRRQCAITMLQLYKRANAGHIGTSLSCLEILVDLCFHRMKEDDTLVLSKGHAAAALYTVLSLSGRLPEAELSTFYEEGTLLAAHPPCSRKIRAIPFGTGSLGHGLGLACGLALSQRFTGKSFRVFAVLSDGDCNEGSTWEAVLFAAHQQLSNLTVVVDLNSIQGIGRTKDILNLEPILDKWKAFGFAAEVAEDGNDFGSLARAYESVQSSGGPRCIIARTVKGHGISYMANRVEWHYLPMQDEQYAKALSELDSTHDGKSSQ